MNMGGIKTPCSDLQNETIAIYHKTTKQKGGTGKYRKLIKSNRIKCKLKSTRPASLN
jgi:hypothetical protein